MTPEMVQEEIMQRYLALKEGATKDQYSRVLRAFFNWLESSGLDSIRPDIIARYKIHVQANSKPATVNKYLAVLKDFFGWCYEMDYLPYDAAKGVKRVRVPKQDKARNLSIDEVKLMLSAVNDNKAGDNNKTMLYCLFYLGLRAHEVANLKVASFDLDRSTVDIMGKGSKLRVLGVSSELKAVIKAHISKYNLESDDYLITSKFTKKGMPVSIQHVNRTFKAIAKRAGINTDGIKSHSGRVTAINFLLDNDISLRDAANFAGHSDISTTRGYDRKSQDKVIQTCNIISFK